MKEYTIKVDESKYSLIEFLVQKDENTIKLAIAYAEGQLKCGVDVTEKLETATQNMAVINRAERHGYTMGFDAAKRLLIHCKDCKHWDRIIDDRGHCRNFMQCYNGDLYTDDDWYCGDADPKDGE